MWFILELCLKDTVSVCSLFPSNANNSSALSVGTAGQAVHITVPSSLCDLSLHLQPSATWACCKAISKLFHWVKLLHIECSISLRVQSHCLWVQSARLCTERACETMQVSDVISPQVQTLSESLNRWSRTRAPSIELVKCKYNPNPCKLQSADYVAYNHRTSFLC